MKKKDPHQGKDQQKVSDKDSHGAGMNKSVTKVEEGGKQNKTNQPEKGASFLGWFGLEGKEKELVNKTDLNHGKDQQKASDKDPQGANSNKNGTLEEGRKENQTNQTEESTSFLDWFGLGGKEKELVNKTDPPQGKDLQTASEKDPQEANLNKNGTVEEGKQNETNQTEKRKSGHKSKGRSLTVQKITKV